MRPEKHILLVDDESQNNDLENIQRNLISEIDVSFSQIEVLNSEHIDNNANFDIEKFKSNLFDFMKREHYDLVLVDYDYGAYVEISGLDVIDIIREEYKSIDIVLYSADQKKVISDVVGDDLSKCTTEDIVRDINKLLNYKISKISRRDAYVSDVVHMLRDDLSPSPNRVLCKFLKDNSSRRFSSCCPKLKDKTFGELAEILEKDNDGRAHEWLKAVIEQTMAYLVEVNE